MDGSGPLAERGDRGNGTGGGVSPAIARCPLLTVGRIRRDNGFLDVDGYCIHTERQPGDAAPSDAARKPPPHPEITTCNR